MKGTVEKSFAMMKKMMPWFEETMLGKDAGFLKGPAVVQLAFPFRIGKARGGTKLKFIIGQIPMRKKSKLTMLRCFERGAVAQQKQWLNSIVVP